MLTYKGYRGHFELDTETGLFHGEVVDTRDVITFQGTSIEELTQAFHDSIDEYLEFCNSTLPDCRPGRGLPPLRG